MKIKYILPLLLCSTSALALDVRNWDLAIPHIRYCESQKDTTMMALNECLLKEYDKVDTRLNLKYTQLVDTLVDPHYVIQAQEAWEKFRDAQCAFDQSGGGSGATYSWNHCLIDLTEKRILDLKKIIPCNGCMEFKRQ